MTNDTSVDLRPDVTVHAHGEALVHAYPAQDLHHRMAMRTERRVGVRMRLFVLVSLAVVGALLAAACGGVGHGRTQGSGHIVTEERDFTEFTALDIENIFDTEIVQSDSFNVTITADDNVQEFVKVSQDGEELKISLERRRYHHITLKVKIAMPDLSGLDLDGLSRVTVTRFKSSQDFHLDLSEASSLSGTMEAGDVVIETSDASAVTLAGSASTLTLDASGRSRVDLADFSVNEASVELSGLTRATVSASERLDPVDLSGDSRLEYLGDPTFGEVDTSNDSAIHRGGMAEREEG